MLYYNLVLKLKRCALFLCILQNMNIQKLFLGDAPDAKKTCKERDNVDITTVAEQAAPSSNWPDDICDSELLAYSTPAEDVNGQNESETIGIFSKVSDHSFSDDSWFDSVDLASLENECLIKLGRENSTSEPFQPILNQANTPTTPVNNIKHKLEDQKLFSTSTPNTGQNGSNKNGISWEVSNHGFSDDSWFDSVDLASLENECLVMFGRENSTSEPLQPILNQANSPTTPVNNVEHELEDQKLFTMSTLNTGQNSSLTTKLTKR